MTVNGRRKLRLFFKLGLLVCLPLAGYLWAQTGISPWTIGLGGACVILALGAEGLASASETKLAQLRSAVEAEDRAFAAEMASQDEKIRQMDHVVETLSNQNHDLRGKLVSLHGEVHRLQEETAHLDRRHPTEETSASEPASGEVTDITSLIKR